VLATTKSFQKAQQHFAAAYNTGLTGLFAVNLLIGLAGFGRAFSDQG